jgi:hypothetical protein
MAEVGLLLFPKLTQLDLTGPFEVLARLPDGHRVRPAPPVLEMRRRIASQAAAKLGS